jgi:hypothetical protein
MTKRLEQAFAQAANLPVEEQDSLAEWLLEELRSERRWEKAFAASQDSLARLADEALADEGAGRTRKLDPDSL